MTSGREVVLTSFLTDAGWDRDVFVGSTLAWRDVLCWRMKSSPRAAQSPAQPAGIDLLLTGWSILSGGKLDISIELGFYLFNHYQLPPKYTN